MTFLCLTVSSDFETVRFRASLSTNVSFAVCDASHIGGTHLCLFLATGAIGKTLISSSPSCRSPGRRLFGADRRPDLASLQLRWAAAFFPQARRGGHPRPPPLMSECVAFPVILATPEIAQAFSARFLSAGRDS